MARSAGPWPAARQACWRTWFPSGSRRSPLPSHEAKRIAIPPDPRPALSRAALALGGCAEDGAAPRLDGRFGFLPIHGGRAAGAVGRVRAGLARLWADRLGKSRLLLVSRLHRRPGCVARA